MEMGNENSDIFSSLLKIPLFMGWVCSGMIKWFLTATIITEIQGKRCWNERNLRVFVWLLCGSSTWYQFSFFPFKLIWFLELISKPTLAVLSWCAAFAQRVSAPTWMHFTGPDLLQESKFQIFGVPQGGCRAWFQKGPKVCSSKVLKGLDCKFPKDFIKSLLKISPCATYGHISSLFHFAWAEFHFLICGFNLAISVPLRELNFLMMLCSKHTRPALLLIVSPSSMSCSSCPDPFFHSQILKNQENHHPLLPLGCTCPAFSPCHKSGWEFALKITLKTTWELKYLWDGDLFHWDEREFTSTIFFSMGNERGFSFLVMDGIKQARSWVLVIYWSPALTYFSSSLVVWCQGGCKQPIALSRSVEPSTPGFLPMIDPKFLAWRNLWEEEKWFCALSVHESYLYFIKPNFFAAFPCAQACLCFGRELLEVFKGKSTSHSESKGLVPLRGGSTLL